MADVPFMDEETGAEEARQRALWALHRPSGAQQPLVQDQEVTPQQLADERFAKSPFGWIDSKLKGAEDWIKGRVKKRQEPFQAIVDKDKAAGLGSSHLSWPDPVELAAMMGVGGARTANRWLYGTKDPSQLRDEDLLGPLGMSAMAAPFAAFKHGASLGSAGGKLAASQATPAFTRQVDDLGYYSKLDEVLGSLRPTDTVTMDTLAKRGVKAAEIEARGLSPFIADGKGAKVSDLQGGAQPVQVRESQYGGPAPANWEYLAKGQYGKPYSELSERARLDIRRQSEVDDYKDPKWRDYATDGDNPSYHEGVLHLPTQLNQYDAHLEAMRAKYAEQHGNGHGNWPMTPEERAKMDKLQESAYGEAEGVKPPFRSGHWEEPNAIAHYRASMQPTEGGGKAYLIDELQSDWGQKLRDGGVRDEAKIGDLKQRHDEAVSAFEATREPAIAAMKKLDSLGFDTTGQAFDAIRRDPHWRKNWDVSEEEAAQFIPYLEARSQRDLLQAELRTAEAATPGNPFVNTTEQWMTTALRRMMRNAAEQEADGIAITPGAVHNERFGLSQHIGGLRYNPEINMLQSSPRGGGGWEELPSIPHGGVTPDKLPEYVGKEMAEKLMQQPREGDYYGGWHSLADLEDVEIGGEGMKYAYDKILPKLLGKELSKLDPSIKYGQQELLSHDTGRHLKLSDSPFHHFPLTPKAREEIMKGLPLFNAPGGPEAIAEALRAQQQLQSPFTQDD